MPPSLQNNENGSFAEYQSGFANFRTKESHITHIASASLFVPPRSRSAGDAIKHVAPTKSCNSYAGIEKV
jgi:hypothetical protein